MPIRQNVGDLESIFTLNDSAARVWDLIDGERTLAEIRDQIVIEFDVDAAQAERDINELVAQLQEFQAVSRN